jgi:hypothetical protein
MTAFKKFDPYAFLERERLAPDSTITFATLATLAGPPLENAIRGPESKILYQWATGAVTAKSVEIQEQTLIHGAGHTPAKVAKAAKDRCHDLGSPSSGVQCPGAQMLHPRTGRPLAVGNRGRSAVPGCMGAVRPTSDRAVVAPRWHGVGLAAARLPSDVDGNGGGHALFQRREPCVPRQCTPAVHTTTARP